MMRPWHKQVCRNCVERNRPFFLFCAGLRWPRRTQFWNSVGIQREWTFSDCLHRNRMRASSHDNVLDECSQKRNRSTMVHKLINYWVFSKPTHTSSGSNVRNKGEERSRRTRCLNFRNPRTNKRFMFGNTCFWPLGRGYFDNLTAPTHSHKTHGNAGNKIERNVAKN